MSLNFSFEKDLFYLKKLALPSRYYYFNDEQNYLKLLTVGEGLFPKDRIKTNIELFDSDVVCSTESATKIYPSKKEFSISKIDITLTNSNFEFINDELILHRDARFLQFIDLKCDDRSTFFYGDILSHGRSFEEFDFTYMGAKNSFKIDSDTEYLEKYILDKSSLSSYIHDMKTDKKIFAKIYIKTKENDTFYNTLLEKQFNSFAFTKNKKMLIGVLSDTKMSSLKKKLLRIWEIYRNSIGKKQFNLGKQ
ncbi:MAG TPA: urease accessory protein UreD [Arcobacter sp.]|jgi:urease accessory protein|nr:urease accessory protein UreD [Arcobacter sp.]